MSATKDLIMVEEEICAEQKRAFAYGYVQSYVINDQDTVLNYVQTSDYIVIQTLRMSTVFIWDNDAYVLQFLRDGLQLWQQYFRENERFDVYNRALSHLGNSIEDVPNNMFEDNYVILCKGDGIRFEFEYIDHLFHFTHDVVITCENTHKKIDHT